MGWQVVAQAGRASLATVAHLVCAVRTALVHTDALGAALYLRLLAAVGWGAEANEGGSHQRPSCPNCAFTREKCGLSLPNLGEDQMVYST